MEEHTRELNRLQKMLEGTNIKLSDTVSDINGKSARSILEYLLTGGTVDSDKYDEMYKQKVIAHNLKATKEQIIDNLIHPIPYHIYYTPFTFNSPFDMT